MSAERRTGRWAVLVGVLLNVVASLPEAGAEEGAGESTIVLTVRLDLAEVGRQAHAARSKRA